MNVELAVHVTLRLLTWSSHNSELRRVERDVSFKGHIDAVGCWHGLDIMRILIQAKLNKERQFACSFMM